MSDYKIPRPLPSASSSDPCVVYDNSVSFDKLINESEVVTTYKGVELQSVPSLLEQIEAEANAAIISLGWDTVGEFSTGFTYTKLNDVGRDTSGYWWRYNGELPPGGYIIDAGTVPSSPDFSVISFETADNVQWDSGKSVGYVLDDYRGVKDELYSQAGIVDNGTQNQLGDSQFVDALNKMYFKRFFSFSSMISYTDHLIGNQYTTGVTRWQVTSVVTKIPVGAGLYLTALGGSTYVDDFITLAEVDHRAGVQQIFDIADREKIIFSANKSYIFNSYSGRGFSSVVNFYTPVNIIVTGAKLILGSFFDDKEFIMFNGLGDDNATPAPVIDGFSWFGGTIDFSGDVSKMRTSYLRRIGIHTGQMGNSSVRHLTMENGDLTNPIIAGEGLPAKRSGVRVKSCTFKELVGETSQNIDHTAIYLKATDSHVVDCIFEETSNQAARVACPVELHGSRSSYRGGSQKGYSKGVILAALDIEGNTEQLTTSGVTASVTNAFAYIWCEESVTLKGCLVTGNNVYCSHNPSAGPTFNTYQGLFTSGALRVNENKAFGITFIGNRTECVYTEEVGRNTAVYMNHNHGGIKVKANEFHNCDGGIKYDIVASLNRDIVRHSYTDNDFYCQNLVDIFCDFGTSTVYNFTWSNNKIHIEGAWTGLSRIVRAQGGMIGSTVIIGDNDVVGAKPAFGVEATIAGNTIRNVLYSATINYPVIAGSSHGLATITHPALTNLYFASRFDGTLKSSEFPVGIDVNRAFIGLGAAPVALVYNHQIASSSALSTSCLLVIETA